MAKKILSKKEFQYQNQKMAIKMSQNKALQNDALKLFSNADKYRWVHQTTWMGEPVLNLPQDMFAIQEIVYNTKPEYIIEVGQAWGGGLLFYASLLELYGGKKVIGVDIFIPQDLKKRLNTKKKIKNKISYINGDSTSPEVLEKIKKLTKNSKKVMVILDSNHTHNHVLNELNLYSPLVRKGNYIICCDTIVEFIPKQIHRNREWGPKNNPFTAMKSFLKKNNRFKIDNQINGKYLFSCHPKGYLKAVK